MCTGDLCRVPPAGVHHGRARQFRGRDHVVIVEGSCGYRARVLEHVFGEIYRQTRGTRLGGRHVAKRSSDSG